MRGREPCACRDVARRGRARRLLRHPLVFALVLLALTVAYPAPAIELDAEGSWQPRAELHYTLDPGHALALDDVLRDGRRGTLPTFAARRPHFGYTRDAVWLYLPLRSRDTQTRDYVAELPHPLLGDVQAWLLVPGEPARHWRGGQSRPAATWPLRNRSFAVPLVLHPGQSAELVLRVASDSSLQLPLTLWSEARYDRSHRDAYLVLGVFFGIVFAVLCYNLMLFVVLRDRNYLRYVAYIGSYLLFQATINGLAFQYLWPAQTRWAQLATPLLGGLTLFTALHFTRCFLELRTRAPRIDIAVMALNAGFVGQMLLTLLAGQRIGSPLLAVLAFLATLLVIGVGSVFSWRGDAQARIYLAAWIAMLIGVASYALRALGLLPDTFVTAYGVQVGAVLQLILLSVALGHRLRGAEEGAKRAAAEHRSQLEQRVSDRTAELATTLERLDRSYSDLASKQRLFEALIDAHEAVRDVEDPDRMLDIALARFAKARPELGMGFLAREPDRPKLLHHVCFHNVEPALSEPMVEALRGRALHAAAPVSLEEFLPGRHGVLIPARTNLRQLEGFFLVFGRGALGAGELQDCVLFADHVGATLEALLLRLKLERIANTDVLTGAYNRNYFNVILGKAIRDKQAHPPIDFSAVMADLNGLKEVNDVHGHEAGDQLIQTAARLLLRICRRSDAVIRWGGDEFLVFCPGTRADEAARLMQRLQAANGQPVRLALGDGRSLDAVLELSFGCASSSTDDAEDVVALADARMLEAKADLYRERRRYR